MAVQIFDKDGEVSYVEPKRLQSHLDSGWSLEKNPSPDSNSPAEILSAREEEENALDQMGILPTINNVVVGATHVRVNDVH